MLRQSHNLHCNLKRVPKRTVSADASCVCVVFHYPPLLQTFAAVVSPSLLPKVSLKIEVEGLSADVMTPISAR